MRIAHIVPSLEERHGGPSKSVRALANAQQRVGLDATLLTTLDPGHTVPPGEDAAALRVFPREWPRALCRSSALRTHLAAERYDLCHAHALWLLTLGYAHLAARRHRSSLVISPRGMMSGWAWEHRRWRKRMAGALLHPGAFAAATGWHATSNEEADDIRRLGFRQPICVAPNGVEIPDSSAIDASRAFWLAACPALRERRAAVFYSRYHRKKRVRELLDLWLAEPRGDWFLLLVGVPEEYDAAQLNAAIAAAGGTERAAAFDGANIPAPFGLASLFLLPSHSENFGLVIAEALAAGVPALVTETTPWSALEERGAGWCVPWADWPGSLRATLSLPPEQLHLRGSLGRDWMRREFTWEASAQTLRQFYLSLT